jgi:serine/threonine protein kinase
MSEFVVDAAKRYRPKQRLGEGAFGEVRLGVDSVTGSHVALKYVRIGGKGRGSGDGAVSLPRAVFRELEALRQLNEGPHVVKLLDVFPDETNLCLVLEYLPSDLGEVIHQAAEHLPSSHIKAYAQMLLSALAYCHSHRIIHRDIKPSNVLLSQSGIVKLGDFGLARVLDDSRGGGREDLSHQVATRWYRPPELLFASKSYSFSADVWSAAVIIGELMALTPLFPGNNDIDQMFRVFQIMGSPTPQIWPGVDALPDFSKVSFPNLVPLSLRTTLLPNASDAQIEFLLLLLRLDPAQRLTAADAAAHSFFCSPPLPCLAPHLAFYPRDAAVGSAAAGSTGAGAGAGAGRVAGAGGRDDELALRRSDGGGGGAAEIEARVTRLLARVLKKHQERLKQAPILQVRLCPFASFGLFSPATPLMLFQLITTRFPPRCLDPFKV